MLPPESKLLDAPEMPPSAFMVKGPVTFTVVLGERETLPRLVVVTPTEPLPAFKLIDPMLLVNVTDVPALPD